MRKKTIKQCDHYCPDAKYFLGKIIIIPTKFSNMHCIHVYTKIAKTMAYAVLSKLPKDNYYAP